MPTPAPFRPASATRRRGRIAPAALMALWVWPLPLSAADATPEIPGPPVPEVLAPPATAVSPPAAAVSPPAAAAETDTTAIDGLTVTPCGTRLSQVFRARAGTPHPLWPQVVSLGSTLDPLVPGALRFQPIPLRDLVENCAAWHNRAVVWHQHGRLAVLVYRLNAERFAALNAQIAAGPAADRLNAIWEAGCWEDDRLIPPLIAAARDADPAIATAAWLALRRLGLPAVAAVMPAAIEPLLLAHLPPPTVPPSGRWLFDPAVVEALASCDSDAVTAALLAWVQVSADHTELQFALYGQLAGKHQPAVTAFWQDLLDRAQKTGKLDSPAEEFALSALAATQPDFVRPTLLDWAEHAPRELRQFALGLLPSCPHPDVVAFLRQQPLPSDPGARLAALSVRAMVGDPTALAPLRELALQKPFVPGSESLACLQYLTPDDQLACLDTILAATVPPDATPREQFRVVRLRDSACEALCLIPGATAEKRLIQLAAPTNRDLKLRLTAVRSLGVRGTPSAVAALQTAIEDRTDENLPVWALEALSDCACPEAVSLLCTIAADPKNPARLGAARALPQQDLWRHPDRFATLRPNADPALRACLAESCGYSRAAFDFGELQDLAKLPPDQAEHDDAVTATAAWALLRIDPAAALRQFEALDPQRDAFHHQVWITLLVALQHPRAPLVVTPPVAAVDPFERMLPVDLAVGQATLGASRDLRKRVENQALALPDRQQALWMLARQVVWLEGLRVPLAPACRAELEQFFAAPPAELKESMLEAHAIADGDACLADVTAFAGHVRVADREQAARAARWLSFNKGESILRRLLKDRSEKVRQAAWENFHNLSWKVAQTSGTGLDDLRTGPCGLQIQDAACPWYGDLARKKNLQNLLDDLVAVVEAETSFQVIKAAEAARDHLFPGEVNFSNAVERRKAELSKRQPQDENGF